jgi:hypothetical protein
VSCCVLVQKGYKLMSKGYVCSWSKFNSECKQQCQDLNSVDPQKERVYCWGEYLHDQADIVEDSLTLDQCRYMIEQFCLRHAIFPPSVHDGRGKSFAQSTITRIDLPRIYREPLSVIHEACHVLVSYNYPQAYHHGSYFVRYMIMNVGPHIGMSKVDLENSAKEFGLDIAPREACQPPPYHIVSPLIDQYRMIKGFHKAAERNLQVGRELMKKGQEAQRQIGTLVKKAQMNVWPKGLHPMVTSFLKKSS